MSGGVGPSSDIKLPKEEEPGSLSHIQETIKPVPNCHFLTFRQLNAIVITIVFAASGMVSLEDFTFTFFSLFYVFFLSKVAFPASSLHTEQVFGNSKLLPLYVWIGAFVGLLFPLVYIFEGILEGDTEGIKAAAPHVFLLSSQIFMEGVTFSRQFSLPTRVFVPVFFNTKRLFTLSEWLRAEIAKVEGEHGSSRRLLVGRGLAVANLVFWSFNLFGFLLPVYLPRAFKRYYGKVKD
ncbi:uncharacterized protein [Aristolochia californica]|uniref:uncharacterized protein n=1 Tax=Aristolochia californica TaxID=171875 RepID=UPI0035DA399A